MPEYLSPGVYVEEIDTGNKPIEGVSTSTAGMLGVTERGPVNVPILITSYGEYRRWFGERLPLADFSNANGPHCFLPHAVEGFFQNEGQRVYVTRVLDENGAIQATEQLFDRGNASSANTLLVRAAGESTGTVANPPLLYVLDPTGLNLNDWIRIGDGSPAEYRQIAAIGTVANNTDVPLNFDLNFPHEHGQPVWEFTGTADGAYAGATFNIVGNAAAGDQLLHLTGLAAAITTLVGSSKQLLQIGDSNSEYQFAQQVIPIDATHADVALRTPLAIPRANSTKVTPFSTPAAPPAPHIANLALDASAGDAVLFVQDRHSNFNTPTNLVMVFALNADHTEVRKIGKLAQLTVSPGAFASYPTGSVLDKVDVLDSPHLAADAPAGTNPITLDDVSGIKKGDQLILQPGLNQEVVTVQSVDTSTMKVTLAAATANLHHALDPITTPFSNKTLAASAPAGSRVLAVDNRVTLQIGDLIRIGTAPTDEYGTIVGIPDRAAAAPDPGTVQIDHPLGLSHAAGEAIRRQSAPVVDTLAAAPSTVLVLQPLTGGTQWLMSDGEHYGDLPLRFVRVTTPQGETEYHRIVSFTFVNPFELTLKTALERAHAAGSSLVARFPLIDVEAIDAGAWGDRLRISVQDEAPGLVSRTQLTTIVNPTHIRLASVAGVESGTVLELLDPLNDDAVVDAANPVKVVAIDRATNFTLTLASALTPVQLAAQTAAGIAGTRLGVRSREFRITVLLMHQPDPSLPSRSEAVVDTEVFRNLSMDPRHSRYFQTIIGDSNGPVRREDRRPEGESWYVRMHDLAQDLAEPTRTTTLESVRFGPETLVDVLPNGTTRPARHALEGGDDSVTTLTDDVYIGADNVNPEDRTGLFSFVNVDDVSIISVPGRTGPIIQGALIDFCENNRYCFGVLDGPVPNQILQSSNDSIADVQAQRQQFDTKYAALYHPWLLIEDPFPVNLANISNYPIPPSGHVLGVYARTDVDRGVHKSPANEVINGILGLQRIINKPEQDVLNPYPVNINVIRDFRHNDRGIRIWGGRVITSDTDWKYVNVRRLLIFIEKSVDLGLQWVVFEPNAEPLWARVKRTISDFLRTVWRNGALEGVKPEEAFFVKCDRTTMTQADIDNGRLIAVIGVAPVKPAEFVIIRIGLFTANATT